LAWDRFDAFLRTLYSPVAIRWRAGWGVSSKPGNSSKSWCSSLRFHTPRTNRPAGLRHRAAGLRAFCGIAHPVGPVGIDVQRPRGALDHLFRDHGLFDSFEARQVEHGVEEDSLHDRAQPTCSRLTIDGLAGDGAKRLLREREVDRLHFEQTLV